MPELPEVETTRRGILSGLSNRRVRAIVVRESRLRWPIPADLPEKLGGQHILDIDRRGKYLLFRFRHGTLLVHLGMSGSLRFVTSADQAPGKHDHVDLLIEGGRTLRYHDPRRFGAFLWLEGEVSAHPLLRDLGPEPLQQDFHGEYLYAASLGRKVPVKQFLMDGHVVVGVGNIYASESLFRAGINPGRMAGRISLERYRSLAEVTRQVLTEAIDQGGTTLRDYVNSSGDAGYFSLKLYVYGRTGQPCAACGAPIKVIRIGQRSTFYCPRCQS